MEGQVPHQSVSSCGCCSVGASSPHTSTDESQHAFHWDSPALDPMITSLFHLSWRWRLLTFSTFCNLIPPPLISLSSHYLFPTRIEFESASDFIVSRPAPHAAFLYPFLPNGPMNLALSSLFSNCSLPGGFRHPLASRPECQTLPYFEMRMCKGLPALTCLHCTPQPILCDSHPQAFLTSLGPCFLASLDTHVGCYMCCTAQNGKLRQLIVCFVHLLKWKFASALR